MSAYDPIIERLLALHPKRIDLSLDRISACSTSSAIRSGNIPPVIHVAGTNGKGSTVAFMRAVLEAAGKSVHVYTSPHLVRFNERFRLGAPGAGQACERRGAGRRVGGMRAGQRRRADHGVRDRDRRGFPVVLAAARRRDLLEVGLGGRLDATNVIETPLACAITPVSMDHLEFLGDTIEKIAAEKAADPQARCAGGDRAAARRRAGGDRAGGRSACARRSASPASIGACTASMAAWFIRTMTACSNCRCRSSPAAIKSTTPAPPSPHFARAGLGAADRGIRERGWRGPSGRRGCSG